MDPKQTQLNREDRFLQNHLRWMRYWTTAATICWYSIPLGILTGKINWAGLLVLLICGIIAHIAAKKEEYNSTIKFLNFAKSLLKSDAQRIENELDPQ